MLNYEKRKHCISANYGGKMNLHKISKSDISNTGNATFQTCVTNLKKTVSILEYKYTSWSWVFFWRCSAFRWH